ncbi:hypothetical protein AVEN_56772-1 [Araneus ventricosus]|uniref:Uncharacterized protein n=1 Tax=Araneus ventricosus TaxID=182803 RepID=A0A4Y2HAN2_ARAVE|nr:hypothetical protein AVEN_56772-1 [Araneus ventricosus]
MVVQLRWSSFRSPVGQRTPQVCMDDKLPYKHESSPIPWGNISGGVNVLATVSMTGSTFNARVGVRACDGYFVTDQSTRSFRTRMLNKVGYGTSSLLFSVYNQVLGLRNSGLKLSLWNLLSGSPTSQ